MNQERESQEQGQGQLRVIVDWDLCQGHGVCEGEAPEVFRIKDDGDMELVSELQPESRRGEIEAACRYCPQQAISIEASS